MCMTVLKVVDYSTYCSRLVMDWLQGYEHDFHSREFKETFSPQREAANAVSSIYLILIIKSQRNFNGKSRQIPDVLQLSDLG